MSNLVTGLDDDEAIFVQNVVSDWRLAIICSFSVVSILMCTQLPTFFGQCTISYHIIYRESII